MPPPTISRWDDACTAAALLAVDLSGLGGLVLRCAAGPVRDRWLRELTQLLPPRTSTCRIPLGVSDARLLGGLDLAASLRAGRPVAERGLLSSADGGLALLAMAERVTVATAARVAAALDTHEVIIERDGVARREASRFAVVALDEGLDAQERPPVLLLERLGLHLDLNDLPWSVTSIRARQFSQSNVSKARARLGHTQVPEALITALCEAATALGVASPRACLLALRAARAAAALAGRTHASEEDAAVAIRLVLAPRATQAPRAREESVEQAAETTEHSNPAEQPNNAGQPDPAEQPNPAPHDLEADAGHSPSAQRSSPDGDQPDSSPLGDRVLQGALATLPKDFFASVQPNARSQSRQSGRSASQRESCLRGRPSGILPGDPRSGARMSVSDTLRAAAPWQRVRRATKKDPRRIRVTRQDFRVIRFKRRNQLTTIFLVDASGSAALHRLAEVKGAVEMMLAESYVRRDRVALIAFRGRAAQVLLPPTHSLARAKRELTALPGGGGTPTALGLDAARSLADSLQRRGEAPVVVMLTDGRPNVDRSGRGGRARAEADTLSAARLMRNSSITAVMVDTAPQPRLATERLAREMGARYVPLPQVNAENLTHVLKQCHRQSHPQPYV